MSLSMKGLIPLLLSFSSKLLRNFLRTSPPQKLGKISCFQVREEEAMNRESTQGTEEQDHNNDFEKRETSGEEDSWKIH